VYSGEGTKHVTIRSRYVLCHFWKL